MPTTQKTAVMYGAGCIGRGFVGPLLHDGGYRVVFVDIDRPLVEALNRDHAYTKVITDGRTRLECVIDNVEAVDGADADAVAEAIAGCAVMAVSVGAASLPQIAPFVAAGLTRRRTRRAAPLNILLCENKRDAAESLRAAATPEGGTDAGFVAAVIGIMVPKPTAAERAMDPSGIVAEPFEGLPVNADALVGEPPTIPGIAPYAAFHQQTEKKLLIHNMGHAVTAYLGFLNGCATIDEAIANPAIREKTRRAMMASATALHRAYGMPLDTLTAYVDDLILRFGNAGLRDTVARVGQDPLRKLAPEDRLVGAIRLCEKNGVDPGPIRAGIDACLRFDAPGDPSALRMRQMLQEKGRDAFLREVCELEPW